MEAARTGADILERDSVMNEASPTTFRESGRFEAEDSPAGNGPAGAAKRICFAVTGNCQAMFVASTLNALPNAEAIFFAGPYRHVRFEGQSAATEPPSRMGEILAQRRAAGERIIFCEQTSPVAEIADIEALAAKGVVFDEVVRFPALQALALWPHAHYDETQIARLGPPRMHRLDTASNASSIGKADVDVQAFIVENFQDQILFDSPRHPAPPLMAELIAALLAKLEHHFPASLREDFRRRVAASRGINTVFNCPVPQHITDALEIRWAQSEAYLLWRDGQAHAKARRWDEARPLLEALLARSEDEFFVRMIAPAAWSLFADGLWALGDKEGAESASARSVELDPWNPDSHRRRALHLERAGDLDGAVRELEQAFEFNPESGYYLESVARIRLKQTRLEEASAALQRAGAAKKKSKRVWAELAGLELQAATAALARAEAAMKNVRVKQAAAETAAILETLRDQAAALEQSRRALAFWPRPAPAEAPAAGHSPVEAAVGPSERMKGSRLFMLAEPYADLVKPSDLLETMKEIRAIDEKERAAPEQHQAAVEALGQRLLDAGSYPRCLVLSLVAGQRWPGVAAFPKLGASALMALGAAERAEALTRQTAGSPETSTPHVEVSEPSREPSPPHAAMEAFEAPASPAFAATQAARSGPGLGFSRIKNLFQRDFGG
jgi:tetratricopeptide (TPR) repeat protein